jgi:hypothetical protein
LLFGSVALVKGKKDMKSEKLVFFHAFILYEIFLVGCHRDGRRIGFTARDDFLLAKEP